MEVSEPLGLVAMAVGTVLFVGYEWSKDRRDGASSR
jgi:hypothetical protein